eukprot:g25020.t1
MGRQNQMSLSLTQFIVMTDYVGAKGGQVFESDAGLDRARRQTKVEAKELRWLGHTDVTRGRGTKAGLIER